VLANNSMTEVHLRCHPARLSASISAIDVRLTVTGEGRLTAVYTLSGSLEKLLLPHPAEPTRRDGLWQETCAELFIRKPGVGDAYLEYNFSPSSAWAAYHFDGYRSGMNPLDVAAPETSTVINDSVIEITVSMRLPTGWQLPALLVGASVVVSEENDNMSYWAIAHPPGKPDFHHRDCFALHLEARSAA
jgi:hypothetical protein